MLIRLFAIAAAIALGLTAWLMPSRSDYPHDLAAAVSRTQGSELRQTACGTIEYAERGTGAPLVMVHGAGGGFDQGLEIAGDLIKTHRVIAVSRFGYLRSPLPADASAEHQSDVYACLLDSLNIDRVAIMGASAGAPSALQFALRHPERTRALVLMVPGLYAPRPPDQPAVSVPPGLSTIARTALRSDMLFWLGTKVATRAMIRSVLGTPPERFDEASAAEQARLRDMLAHVLPVSARVDGLMNDAAVLGGIARYDLEKVRAQTLLLSMADDLYGTYAIAQYTAEHVPGARFVGFPAGGHMGVGHQAEIAQAIGAFLDETAGP